MSDKYARCQYERSLIQDIIHKQQEIRYTNFNWSVTIFSGMCVVSASNPIEIPVYLTVAICTALFLCFLVFDLCHRREANNIFARSRHLETCLRGEVEYDGIKIEESIGAKSSFFLLLKDARFIAQALLLICLSVIAVILA